MARGKSAQPSTSSIFRKYFQADPALLDTQSLEAVMVKFVQDHPDLPVTSKIRQIAANVKSTEKKKVRGGASGNGRRRGRPPLNGRRRRGRPPMAATAAAAAAAAAPAAPSPRSRRALEELEEKIDECLGLAKHADRDGLLDVIRLLRRALNGVVVKIEEK
jgi:hypothetical protein